MLRRFEAIRTNTTLQNLWTRRIIAFIIDSFVLLVVFAILSAVLAIILVPVLVFSWDSYGGFFSGFSALFGFIIVWGYYVAFEGSTGATIGKRFMDLRVRSLRGNMNYTKAFTRSFTKAWLPAFVVLFLLDLFIGFITEGDPKQRFSDVVADTAVVHTRT
jgi:uncharacterized RDD family membrane protein YckC